MKPLLILSLIICGLLPAGAQSNATSPALDGASMQSGDIAKQWQKAPQAAPKTRTVTRGFRTRSITPAAETSAPSSRSVRISPEAMKANEAVLKSLRLRGVKIHKGAEAVAAQQLQDQSVKTPTQSARPQPDSAVVEMPVAPEKQISFRIKFQQDSTELADEQSSLMVEEIAKAMKTVPDAYFLLEGHTCDLGDEGYNLRLSEKRALKVRDLLVSQGIEPARLLSVGQGELMSAVPNTSDENRALNRRVMIGPIELTRPN